MVRFDEAYGCGCKETEVTISGVAVDCGWLMEQHEATYAENLEAMKAFEFMRAKGMNVLIDHEGKILAEYERNLAPNTFGKKLFIHLMKLQMFYSVSGTETRACTACLDEVDFDPSDRPYISAAQHGRGAYLTHESKHHVSARVSQIATRCGVPILDTAAFAILMS